MVPSSNRNIISGWSNYSDKVTSQKMIEKEMAYRGSKSKFLYFVKEQRVDGSWQSFYLKNCLRCTLTGLERDYQVRIPSKQTVISRLYTTSHKPLIINKSNLNHWFVTGFCDAESSFSVLIQRNNRYMSGWRVKMVFAIALHNKDRELLEEIRSYFSVGGLHVHSVKSIQYRVESIKDLEVIIEFFSKYPLISTKVVNYTLFKEAFHIVRNNEHLNKSGLLRLLAIKYHLNLGINEELKQNFSDWHKHAITKPSYNITPIPDPYWIAGFTSGDGSFNIKVSNLKNSTSKRVQLRFEIGLSIVDEKLVKCIGQYLSNNKLLEQNNKMSCIYYKKNSVSFEVTNFPFISNNIIPFFDKYRIQGTKSFDLGLFKSAAIIIRNKEHLTEQGFNKLMVINGHINKK